MMGTYFRVYHRRSREPLATYDERQIVDFCMSNKDTIGNYSFSIAGSKDLMEWEAFAVKYSHLFVQRARKREQEERQAVEAADKQEIQEQNRKPLYVIGAVAALVLLVVAGALVYYFFFRKAEAPTAPVQAPVTAAPAETAPAEPAKPVITTPAKREPRPGDDAFTGTAPSEKALSALWKKNKKKLGAMLTPIEIKEEMDKYLPGIQKCFADRAKAGDRGLKGTVNMKIRVAGNGAVLDVLFTDEKYKATLFADCLAGEIKAQKFRLFRSKEQVFSYYFDL